MVINAEHFSSGFSSNQIGNANLAQIHRASQVPDTA
jgi:hypothetical protein